MRVTDNLRLSCLVTFRLGHEFYDGYYLKRRDELILLPISE
jgi:hypothetical protein